VKPGVVEKMIDDLRWMGLDWDGEVAVQSARRDLYRSVFEKLRPQLYACRCSRAEIAAVQSAPHEGDAEPRYPGTCATRNVPDAEAVAWRFRVPPGPLDFDDACFGRRRVDVAAEVGDVAVFKRPEQPAYQLAVVADDLDQGVTEVVRGDDLIPSTGRQILLWRALGAEPPAYGHVPLVVGPDGKRLAKRHGDARIATLREAGLRPERLVGWMAEVSGLGAGDLRPADLLPRWSWEHVSRERVVLTPESLATLTARK
jgi:glutamyl-tRNA synthetase